MKADSWTTGIWILVSLTLTLGVSYCQLCTNTYDGEPNPAARNDHVDTANTVCTNTYDGELNPNGRRDHVDTANTGMTYMMQAATHAFGCCGVIDRWQFRTKGMTGTQTLYLMVFKPLGGDQFELIGRNSYTFSTNTELTYNVVQASRITIMDGWFYGWWTSGGEVISYDDGIVSLNDDNWRVVKAAAPSEGDTVDFAGKTVLGNRNYGIRVDYIANTAPVLTVTPATVSILNNVASNILLSAVTFTDVNTYDTHTLANTGTNAQFSFNTATGEVRTATLTDQASTVTLTFLVTDICGNTDTATLTVTIVNVGPTIWNTPNNTYLHEDTVLEKLLYTIIVTDPTDDVTCALNNMVPAVPFIVKVIPGTSDYGIYYEASLALTYNNRPTYSLTYTCDDGDQSDSGDYDVYLIRNIPPVLLNLQNATFVSTSSTLGSLAFQVLAYDADGDVLSFSMTCSPNCDPFQIYDDGSIQVSILLAQHNQVAYDLFITVCDTRHNCDGPNTLTIDITDINFPVFFTNLPFGSTRVVPENTGLGTSVMQLSIWDSDPAQVPVYSFTSSPPEGALYFNVDANGLITTAGDILNFEALAGGVTTYSLNVTVSDTVSADAKTLDITIIDVNEPPTWTSYSYGLTANEGAANTDVGTPGFVFTDPDAGDTHTYTMDCSPYNVYFMMNGNSGMVRYQVDYDLDTGTLPTTIPCTVNVTDAGGLVDTATLTLTIVNLNDNIPTFFPGVYAFYASPYSGVGTVIGTTVAIDDDIGTFGDLSFRLDQSMLGDNMFAIDGSGRISINSVLNYSTSYVLKAIVADGGGLEATATVTVLATDTTTVAPTTTTWEYEIFWDNPYNWAWFIPLFLVIIGTTSLTCWVACTCRGKHGCEATCARLFTKRTPMYKLDRVSDRRPQRPRGQGPPSNPVNSVRQAPAPAYLQSWRRQAQPGRVGASNV